MTYFYVRMKHHGRGFETLAYGINEKDAMAQAERAHPGAKARNARELPPKSPKENK